MDGKVLRPTRALRQQETSEKFEGKPRQRHGVGRITWNREAFPGVHDRSPSIAVPPGSYTCRKPAVANSLRLAKRNRRSACRAARKSARASPVHDLRATSRGSRDLRFGVNMRDSALLPPEAAATIEPNSSLDTSRSDELRLKAPHHLQTEIDRPHRVRQRAHGNEVHARRRHVAPRAPASCCRRPPSSRGLRSVPRRPASPPASCCRAGSGRRPGPARRESGRAGPPPPPAARRDSGARAARTASASFAPVPISARWLSFTKNWS